VLGGPRTREWIKIYNSMILGVIKVVVQSKIVDVVLEKVKAHSGDKQNKRADRIAKEGDKANVLIRVKQVMTKKKRNKILDSIKEELKQKEKIDLDSNWLREVFIPKDKEEYRNRHIEWSREFLADDIGLALEKMTLSKNKAQDIAVTFFDKWLTFFQREVWKEHCSIINEWKKTMEFLESKKGKELRK
ncbi:5996_t:CDS:2, partial [Gigaspora margarita]